MNYMIQDDEAQKLINDHLELMKQYNENFKLLTEEIRKGIDTTPPSANDAVLPICICCWFNKSFYISMFLLKDHSISKSFIDPKWGVPTLKIYIKAENIELIKMTGLSSSFSKKDFNWPLNWDKESEYYDTWEYINKNHPRLQVFREELRFSKEVKYRVNKDHEAIRVLIEEVESVYEHTKTQILEYGEACAEYRNKIYSAAVKKYSLNKFNNEVLLFSMVRCVFLDALFQYRTDFLNEQSLDIYIPSEKFAIEYQGELHFKSVSTFGGEESLRKRQALDSEKEKVCRKHGITLCPWYYDIPINEYNLINTLSSFLHRDFIVMKEEFRQNVYLVYRGWLGEEFLKYASKIRYVRPKKEIHKSEQNNKSHIDKQFVYRQYDVDGKFVKQFTSIEQAAEEIHVKPVTINKACKGLQNLAGGFQWRKCEFDSSQEDISQVEERTISSGPRPVYQIDLDGVIIKKHESIQAASKEVGVDPKNIRAVLKGIQKKAGGYYWDYA